MFLTYGCLVEKQTCILFTFGRVFYSYYIVETPAKSRSIRTSIHLYGQSENIFLTSKETQNSQELMLVDYSNLYFTISLQEWEDSLIYFFKLEWTDFSSSAPVKICFILIQRFHSNGFLPYCTERWGAEPQLITSMWVLLIS